MHSFFSLASITLFCTTSNRNKMLKLWQTGTFYYLEHHTNTCMVENLNSDFSHTFSFIACCCLYIGNVFCTLCKLGNPFLKVLQVLSEISVFMAV